MSRLITCGFDVQIAANNTSLTAEAQDQAYILGVTFDTSVKHGTLGNSSMVCNALSEYSFWTLTLAAGTDYYLRFYFRFSANPANQTSILLVESTRFSLRLETTGKLRLYNAAGTAVGVGTSAALSTGDFHEIGVHFNLPAAGNGTLDLYVDKAAVDTAVSAAIGTGNGSQLKIGVTNSTNPSATLYFDDLALNDGAGSAPFNTYPETGYCMLLRPVSDNAIGGSWQAPQTTGADVTNIYDAVDNAIPAGVAHSDVDANNLKYVFDAVSEAASYDVNINDYANAGIPAESLIRVVQGMVRVGTSSLTSTNAGVARLVSNPADSADTAIDFEGAGATAGTEYAGWRTYRTEQQVNPSVTRGTQPVLRVRKTTLATRVHMCDFMAVLVEYTNQRITPDAPTVAQCTAYAPALKYNAVLGTPTVAQATATAPALKYNVALGAPTVAQATAYDPTLTAVTALMLEAPTVAPATAYAPALRATVGASSATVAQATATAPALRATIALEAPTVAQCTSYAPGIGGTVAFEAPTVAQATAVAPTLQINSVSLEAPTVASATAYAPALRGTVALEGPTVAQATAAAPALRATISLGAPTVAQVTAYAPALRSTVSLEAPTVSHATAYAPALRATVALDGPSVASATAFAPSLRATTALEAPTVAQATAYAPALRGTVALEAPTVAQATATAPSLRATVALEAPSVAVATAYAPALSINAISLGAPTVAQCAAYDPELSIVIAGLRLSAPTVAPATAYAPALVYQVATETPTVAQATAFSVALSGRVSFEAPTVAQATAYAPALSGAVALEAPTVAQATAYAPAIDNSVALGAPAVATATALAPSLSINSISLGAPTVAPATAYAPELDIVGVLFVSLDAPTVARALAFPPLLAYLSRLWLDGTEQPLLAIDGVERNGTVWLDGTEQPLLAIDGVERNGTVWLDGAEEVLS